MKKLLLFSCLWLTYAAAFAQQKPQFSQYMLNNYINNPAITGIEDYMDIRLSYRQQWMGIEGAPQTFYASFHTPLDKADRGPRKTFRVLDKNQPRNAPNSNRLTLGKTKPHHGLGGMAIVDKSGAITTTNVTGSYAFHIPVTRSMKLSAGASIGAMNYAIDPSRLTLFDPNDPTLGSGNLNRLLLDLNVGVWAYSKNFYLGASVAQILKNKNKFHYNDTLNYPMGLQRHFYLTGGYRIKLLPSLALIPSVFVKFASPSPVAIDINCKALYMDRLFAGVSYRQADAFIFLGGINISPALDVSYSYDATSSSLNNFNLNTHEVVIGIKLFNKNQIICPLWLW